MLRNFADDHFDIIIQAGQSNSEGYGFGDTQNPYTPNEKVWYLNADFTITLATEWVCGNLIQSNFSLSFARQYISNGLLEEGRKILIIRAAVGGTGFLDHRWGLKDDLFLRMMEMIKTALELNKNNRLVAFLWHQDETDASLNATYETHHNNLLTLVNTVRETFNCPELPFIAGDFVAHWKNQNIAICEPVINAIKDVCKAVNGRFVLTDELLSNAQTKALNSDDIIHFSRDSLYRLGEKYFEAFREIISSVK